MKRGRLPARFEQIKIYIRSFDFGGVALSDKSDEVAQKLFVSFVHEQSCPHENRHYLSIFFSENPIANGIIQLVVKFGWRAEILIR